MLANPKEHIKIRHSSSPSTHFLNPQEIDILTYVYQITCVACLRIGIRTKYIGETSRAGYEWISEHINGLRRCLEAPDGSLDDANPLLKHQWMYHQGEMPDYWAKVITKHFTAFSRQIREGVIISRMAESTDIIMNSKKEITGSRVSRKRIKVNDEEVEILSGDIEKLESRERKLLKELEEG